MTNVTLHGKFLAQYNDALEQTKNWSDEYREPAIAAVTQRLLLQQEVEGYRDHPAKTMVESERRGEVTVELIRAHRVEGEAMRKGLMNSLRG